MKWINDLKKIMYSNCSFNIACEINDVIFEYDKYRSKNEEQIENAGKEWYYRLKKICDFKVEEK